jgi:hypothetical protein
MRITMKNTLHHSILAGVAALSLFGVGLAHADVDTSKSTVIATTKQMNVPVDGKFRKFSAQLSFDPATTTRRRKARNGSTAPRIRPQRLSPARSRRRAAISTRSPAS